MNNMELTDSQVLFIENELRQQGIDYQPLREELLDHICCAIEGHLQEGENFEVAYTKTIEAFGQQGIIQVQHDTIDLLTKKTKVMKKIFFLTTLMVLSILTISIANSVIDPPSRYPTLKKLQVTSHYGNRMYPILKVQKMHKGIDFKAPMGTPIVATADGVILVAQSNKKGYGTHIIIKHDKQYKSLYAHLSKMKVVIGQEIKKGEVIGYSGNSGASVAPHLHYEVRKDDKAVDPKSYLP